VHDVVQEPALRIWSLRKAEQAFESVRGNVGVRTAGEKLLYLLAGRV
jgi:hypothetical protein